MNNLSLLFQGFVMSSFPSLSFPWEMMPKKANRGSRVTPAKGARQFLTDIEVRHEGGVPVRHEEKAPLNIIWQARDNKNEVAASGI